ncbi:insulinase family protein [Psychroflexus sediminis]|uniref:Predicted Zn-dependent peptidase n=1 Tax=Psychroflexus sediminis TaxID=470826 RepID=A0A1G7YSX8_9FLAO|nr:insulinase family protein [Psychroflexus sediminis]SDG99618.1 Predicted Zn-dependent peptidase [Psychroflexus sediminis]
MKTISIKLVAFIGVALIAFGVNAQIDRSQMPEAGPEPKINLEKPKEFKLKNGITLMVVENNKLPRVSYQLRIDNLPYKEGDKAGVASLLSAMLGNGTTSISKDDFNEEVDFLGASISFGSSGAFGSGLAKYSDRIVELMADATINPLLVEEEFEKEKEKLIENLKSSEKSLDAVSGRVVSALAYGKDHVYGEYLTEETVNNVTFQDVKDLYQVRFAPNDAYIVVVGDIDPKAAKKQIKKFFGDWEKQDLPNITEPKLTENVSTTQINFIDMPNASQTDITVTNNVDLKQNDEDYFAALMANNILGGGGEGYLFKNLREDKGYTYGAYSSLGSNRYGVSRFNASAKVRNAVADSAVVEFVKEIKRIRTEPVDAQTLENAKAKYVGNFVMALERPQTIANYALSIKLNNLPQDFYENYLDNINKVSAEDVKAVSQKYFKIDNARIVMVGKGSEVVDKLDRLNLPVNYFDQYANPIDKPEFKKELPEGVTVATVYEDYITAVGGEEAISKVNSMMMKGNASVQGMTLSFISKAAKGGKSLTMIEMNGMTLSKQVFDGEKGYAAGQGQRIDLNEQQVKDSKASSGLFPELSVSENAELKGIESVNGEEAYVVQLTDNVREFYSVDSGLKLATETTAEQMGQKMVSTISYLDYTDKNGILIPMTLSQNFGPQTVDIKIEEVKFNEGVTDADFE